MKVVLADIDLQNLQAVERELLQATTADRILPLQVDVGKKENILMLANKTIQTFGRVDLLFNHAGIPGPIGPIWEASYEAIEKVVQVNLLSMLYNLRAFLPTMLAQGTPGHIVNTASGAGLHIACDMTCYSATKRAVVALSEILSLDLSAAQSKIHASVLCPGMVSTNFGDMVPNVAESDIPSVQRFKQHIKAGLLSKGIPVEKVVDATFKAIQNEQFYILTHIDEHRDRIQNLTDNMLSGKNPIDFAPERNG